MKKITKLFPLWLKEPVAVFLQEVKNGHPYIALCHAMCSFSDIYPCSDAVRKRIYAKSHRAVAKFLHRKYASLIAQKQINYSEGQREEYFPIWVFWWQGEVEAPKIVKICIENTRKHAGPHPVHVISRENYESFVSLPSALLKEVQNGKISVTHLSDVLRMTLLAELGGLWLDATVYCTKLLDGPQFEQPVFTGRNPGGDYTNVSNWEWTTYAMFGWKGNWLYSLVRDVFYRYLEEHSYFVDYFLMDHIIRLVTRVCVPAAQELRMVECNNEDVYLLNQQFDNAYTEKLEWAYKNSQTWLYKLTWKKEYALKTEDGLDTFYAKWLAENRMK